MGSEVGEWGRESNYSFFLADLEELPRKEPAPSLTEEVSQVKVSGSWVTAVSRTMSMALERRWIGIHEDDWWRVAAVHLLEVSSYAQLSNRGGITIRRLPSCQLCLRCADAMAL